jgi:dihydropteroate synthase
MGIVNINDDSFSGDGTLDPTAALAIARNHLTNGADIIDIGAESARTNRTAIPINEEIRRLRSFIDRWQETWPTCTPRDATQIWPPILSVNSWRNEVITAILQSPGIDLITDMSALPDARNAITCANANVSLLIMHSVGEPKIPHFQQQWPNVMNAMESFFEEKIRLATQAGLPLDSIIIDPGIDFAKQRADNLTVYQNLSRLNRFQRPILVPVSRKTVIGEVLNLPEPSTRDAGTIACIAAAIPRGGSIFRVHDSDAAWQAVKMLHALQPSHPEFSS